MSAPLALEAVDDEGVRVLGFLYPPGAPSPHLVERVRYAGRTVALSTEELDVLLASLVLAGKMTVNDARRVRGHRP